jgi:hypothetical protein
VARITVAKPKKLELVLGERLGKQGSCGGAESSCKLSMTSQLRDAICWYAKAIVVRPLSSPNALMLHIVSGGIKLICQ